MIFPDGVVYNHKNQASLTDRVNDVFYYIVSLASNTGENKKGQPNKIIELSSRFGMTDLINGFIIFINQAVAEKRFSCSPICSQTKRKSLLFCKIY